MSTPIDDAAVWDAISRVEDPEVPVTLADLGVVRSVRIADGMVRVLLRPTRLACPARAEMARRVEAAASSVAPSAAVEVVWEMASWQPADVTACGKKALQRIGYADPLEWNVKCPFCRSEDIRRESEFGGSVCKIPYSCRACGSTFDVLKQAIAARPRE